MRRGVAILAVFVATLVASPLALSDVIWIPMSTKIEQLKADLLDKGINLSGSDDSDGHIENYGTKVKIVTNRWMEDHEMQMILEAAVNARR